ncbi:MAG: ABC transporter substrate-binding protein [Candidatus Cloacimonetes bacterium]|nr:ABC transporter substrate-binding protein [Candidatus Cloacimonadota bacterium]
MKKKYMLGSIIMISLLMISCSSKMDILQVGIISPSTNHLSLLIALDEGLINDNEIKIHRFSSGWEANEALINGKIDLAIMPFTYAWQAVSERRKVKIISFLERESDGIIAHRNITAINDLDGKKLGVLRASTLDIFFQMLLDDYNILPEVIYFRTPTEMATALQNGYVDALSFYVPPLFHFDDNFHILLWYSELYPEHPCCDILVYEDSLVNKKEQIERFLEGVKIGCQILESDSDQGIKTIMSNFGLARDVAEKTLKQQKFKLGLEPSGKEFQEKVARKMLELGYLRATVSSQEVYYDFFEVE